MLNKNKLALGSALLMVFINGHAAIPGAYIGWQVGYSHIGNTGPSQAETGTLIAQGLQTNDFSIQSFHTGTKGNGFANRIFIGILGNPYWAIEFGYTSFPNIPVHTFASGVSGAPVVPFLVTTSGTTKVDDFDLTAKGILPLPYHFNLYGKLGGAFIEYRITPTAFINESGSVISSKTHFVDQRFYPTFGLGISYDFTPCFAMELAWNRVQSVGGDSQRLGSTDFANLGFIYYMGQF